MDLTAEERAMADGPRRPGRGRRDGPAATLRPRARGRAAGRNQQRGGLHQRHHALHARLCQARRRHGRGVQRIQPRQRHRGGHPPRRAPSPPTRSWASTPSRPRAWAWPRRRCSSTARARPSSTDWACRPPTPARPTWWATCPRAANTARGWNRRPSSTAIRCWARAHQHRRGAKASVPRCSRAASPCWGYHLDAPRRGTHHVKLHIDVESTADWGLLGYWIGDRVQERVPVVDGLGRLPNLARLKHFGAAASSSGGVEMYHLVGVTPEALTLEQAFGGQQPLEVLHYGATERREALRAHQQHRRRPQGRLRDAGLPALFDRADLGSGAAARRPEGACRLRTVDLHPAGHQGAGRPERLHQGHRRRRRAT